MKDWSASFASINEDDEEDAVESARYLRLKRDESFNNKSTDLSD